MIKRKRTGTLQFAHRRITSVQQAWLLSTNGVNPLHRGLPAYAASTSLRFTNRGPSTSTVVLSSLITTCREGPAVSWEASQAEGWGETMMIMMTWVT